MKKVTLADRLRYRFDNFMSRGTIALVGALFAVTFLMILSATLILVLYFVAQHRGNNWRRSRRSSCRKTSACGH